MEPVNVTIPQPTPEPEPANLRLDNYSEKEKKFDPRKKIKPNDIKKMVKVN